MRAKVDMGDPATAKAFAGAIAARMSLPVSDPAYMPVTRDLSPTRTKMVVDFMANWARGRKGLHLMSYLDFPRLHFSGLLYNYPNTINNSTANFNPATQLTDANGAYIYDVVSWAPLGSGQVYSRIA